MDEGQEKQAQEGAAAESALLDQLIDMTGGEPEERGAVKETFDYILKEFEGKEAVSALDKAFLDDLIWSLDESLSDQVGAIMQHPDFKKVEAAWRGLHFLVQRTDFSKNNQIDVMQATKKEMLEDLQADSLDQSHLFGVTYRSGYDAAGGYPYGAIVGDFEFESGGQDMELLSRVSDVAEACHAPFISSVGPSFFNVKDWKEYLSIPNLSPYLEMKDFAQWKGFREKESSRYVGLTLPKFILRDSYGPKGIKIDAFNFSEAAEKSEDYLWGNAAYAYASKITESFANDGWVVRVSGGKNAGGVIADLPVVNYDIGTEEVKIPTEMAITDAEELEFSNNGLMALVPYKNQNVACFFGCNSTQKPAVYSDADATANAELGAKLPYIFPVSRVAHYLKSIQRDNIGTFASPIELETELKNWIKQYYSESKNMSQDFAAKFPFKGYEVKVTENPAKPGWFNVDIWVEPRIVIQGISGKLHLVTQVKSKD